VAEGAGGNDGGESSSKMMKGVSTDTTGTTSEEEEELSSSSSSSSSSSRQQQQQQQQPLTYLMSQKLILMGMGWMYFLAFYGAYRQNEGLMGSRGLVPSGDWFDKMKQQYQCSSEWSDLECRKGFMNHPSLFWWIEVDDETTRRLLLAGTTLSLLCGLGSHACKSMAVWLTLWIFYFSVVTSASGTSFYSYGWESQVLETGFLCAFLCPNYVWPYSTSRQQHYASPLVLWLFRWLCFRISIGAGIIKIRGDSCWTQKTCLLYHFETQPIPCPLSFAFHFLPGWMLQRAVDLDLFVQVYTSWFVVLPTFRSNKWMLPRLLTRGLLFLVRVGGVIQTAFMFNIALSGNLSMLNHLTIIPALACLDDTCYPAWIQKMLLPDADNNISGTKKQTPSSSAGHNIQINNDCCYQWRWRSPRAWIDGLLWAGIVYLSIPVVENLLQLDGGHQKMNASFGSFRLVNTYGAFGSVGKKRYEPIVSIAYAKEGNNNVLEWIEIDFPCKPGSLDRRPCFCAPYHYRLDWNIWFIGFKPHSSYLNRRESWLYNLLAKILGYQPKNDTNSTTDNGRERPWLELLDTTSSELLVQRGTPLYARVDMYRYKMAAPLWKLLPEYLNSVFGGSKHGVQWWNRYYEEELLPVIAFDHNTGRLVRAEV